MSNLAKHSLLASQNEKLKEKLSQISRENAADLQRLQDQIQALALSNQKLLSDRRDLEVRNDELECKNRVAEATICDLQQRLEKAVETSVWLQGEHEDYTRHSEETIQRLRDDVRDFQSELVIRSLPLRSVGTSSATSFVGAVDPMEVETDKTALTSSAVKIPILRTPRSTVSGHPLPISANGGDTISSSDPLNLLKRMMLVAEDIEERLSSCQTTCQNLLSTITH